MPLPIGVPLSRKLTEPVGATTVLAAPEGTATFAVSVAADIVPVCVNVNNGAPFVSVTLKEAGVPHKKLAFVVQFA